MSPMPPTTILTCSWLCHGVVQGPWSSLTLSPDERAEALLREMTLDEKIAMLHGPMDQPNSECAGGGVCAYTGNVASNLRLGIPPLNMEDGPQGFRHALYGGTSTAWPSSLAMSSSWDPAIMLEWGRAMGAEFYAKGANVQLGPGLCLERVPNGGRSYEYLSGEDPFLGYTLVQPLVKGVQSQRVMATAKHWVLNSQETNAQSIDEVADERTRFELYYPPFEGAIEAGVGSFMCSYNKLLGRWSCENHLTLAHDLKTVLGFRGFVMSDWGGTHSTSIMDGLDIEMPGAEFINSEILQSDIKTGNVTAAKIDDSARRVLRSMFAVGIMDAPNAAWDWRKLATNVTTDASVSAARKFSAASTVLLKNEGAVLPLPLGRRIAVLGFGGRSAIIHGAMSGSVVPSHVITPLEGLKAAAGPGSEVLFDNGTNISAAAALAGVCDYAVVFVGTLSNTNPDESQRNDRPSLSLDVGCDDDQSGFEPDYHQCLGNAHRQNEMVVAVAMANPKTIVVASVPGPTLLPWSTIVPAILTNFLPGQQVGHAIADVLFGKVNPSAKLPVTFPNIDNETNLSPSQWPGVPLHEPKIATYSEGLLVGYRYYDAHRINFSTGFAFGHGLSYTTFEYSSLRVQSWTILVDVKNVGSFSGAEVVQLYVGFPSSAGEPPKQLKGFHKTQTLQAGESETIKLQLKDRDFSIWDAADHRWSRVYGMFNVFIGSSSRDIRLQRDLRHVKPARIILV